MPAEVLHLWASSWKSFTMKNQAFHCKVTTISVPIASRWMLVFVITIAVNKGTVMQQQCWNPASQTLQTPGKLTSLHCKPMKIGICDTVAVNKGTVLLLTACTCETLHSRHDNNQVKYTSQSWQSARKWVYLKPGARLLKPLYYMVLSGTFSFCYRWSPWS